MVAVLRKDIRRLMMTERIMPRVWMHRRSMLSGPGVSLCNSSTTHPSTYLEEGSDNSPPLKRISSRDSEVCGRKEGYSALRRFSLSHVASFSEWCDHCTLRNLIF